MEEEIKDQLIQDYLEGNLKGKALKDFENKLQQDLTLAAEVQNLQNIEHELHSMGVHQFKNEVKHWEAAYQQSQITNDKVFTLRPYYAIAAAISLVIVAGIYLFMNSTPDMNQLYAQNFVPYDDMILDRSNEPEGAQSFLIAGMEAYNHQQYALAEENLKEYLLQAPEHYGAALYLGIAQMEITQFDAAEVSLKQALNDSKFAQQAQWYLSLLYLKTQQSEKAKASLRTIAQNPQHYKLREAAELLEDIE